VILSDEQDCSDGHALGESATGEDCYTRPEKLVPVADLVADLRDERDGDPVILDAIVGPEVEEGCSETVPGRRYYEAAWRAGGLIGSICDSGNEEMLADLGAPLTGLYHSFVLSERAVVTTIEVRIDPPSDPLAAESYSVVRSHDGVTAIVFPAGTAPPRGARVELTYERAE